MGDFNADELHAPSWMSEEFFQDVLRKCEHDDSVSVTEVKITPATVKGDHYASVMFRGMIGYDTSKSKAKSKSLIIKTMPELDGFKKEMLGESFIFETEINMYSKTIPQFEAELRKIGDNTVLGAKVVYSSLEPRKCIIFEDIVPQGYEVLRDRLLDMTESKAAYLKLAKWHAISYKLGAEGDKSVTDYREGFLNIRNVEEMGFMQGFELFVEKLKTIDGYETYIPKLEPIRKDLIKRCIKSANTYREPGAKGIFALCHGDFHAKNLMFKRNDKGELEDVMLLDFQLCYYGPAVMDLMYSIYMILKDDLRRDHRDELIHYYCSNFIDTLKKLKFKGEYPKIADFFIELIKHSHMELFLLSTFLPVWYAFAEKSVEPEEVMTSDLVRKSFYDNPKYLQEVQRVLPTMLYNGFLE